MDKEKVIDNIDKLEEQLLSFLKFDELTSDVLYRLINKIEVKEDGNIRVHYRFNAPTFE